MIGGGCLIDGKYNMTAVRYTLAPAADRVVDPDTGQNIADYLTPTTTSETFELIARGLSNLRGKDSGTLQDWGNKLNEYHYLRIKTMLKLVENDLVTNIRDANGEVYLNDRIQFVVLGITPTYDPFGNFIEYDVLCNKSESTVKLT